MCCHIEHFNYYITLSFNGHIDRKRKDNWKLLSDFLFSAALESFPLTRHVLLIMTLDKCKISGRSILGSVCLTLYAQRKLWDTRGGAEKAVWRSEPERLEISRQTRTGWTDGQSNFCIFRAPVGAKMYNIG